jgi:2-methylcitrate dehydratase PrpD
MEFCIAILLLERQAGLAQFTDDVVLRPDVQEMLGRVHFGLDPEAEANGYNNMTTIIRVELQDGRTLTTRADFGRGSPQNPMTDDELTNKFANCMRWGGIDIGPGSDPGGDLVARVRQIEDEPSVRRLVPAFVREAVE